MIISIGGFLGVYEQHKFNKSDEDVANNKFDVKLAKELEKMPILQTTDKDNIDLTNDELVKKYNISTSQNIDIKGIKKFSIVRATKSKILDKYFIIDESNNLLVYAQKDEVYRFNLYNKNGDLIGKIERNDALIVWYIVRNVNEKPFSIRKKVQLNNNYDVIGTNYYVAGSFAPIDNVIFDREDNKIAVICAKETNSGSYELGNTTTEIVDENTINSLTLMCISLCVTIENFYSTNRGL